MKDNKKKILMLIILLGVLALSLVAAAFIIGSYESVGEGDYEEESLNMDEILNAVEIDGEVYYPKRAVRNYLIMGIDKFGDADGGTRGQADFLMILSFDALNETYDMVAINRDTMVNVDYYDIMGNKGEARFEQIALSHAYGNVLEISNKQKCLNTQKSVSELFGQIEFYGYMSMTMDAVSIMVDHVGGVDVVVDEDLTSVDPRLKKGERVLMDGELALKFVRARGGLDDSSNIARMKRQEAFLERFFEKLGESGADMEAMMSCYEKVASKLVSNIGESGYEELVSRLCGYKKEKLWTPDGEASIGKQGYVEFYVDEESIKEILTGVFYDKAD